jgi:cell cycle checkpoint protein
VIEADFRLDALTRKDQNLGLFHALGKIMYNKRKLDLETRPVELIRPGLGDPGEDKEDQETVAVIRALPAEDVLPDHLSEYQRRRSLIQIEVS